MPRHPRKKTNPSHSNSSLDESRRKRLSNIWAYLDQSYDLNSQARFAKAEAVLRRALRSLRTLTPGPDVDEPLSICLSNLVSVLHEIGRFVEAEACGIEALEIAHPEILDSVWGNLASLYTTLDRYSEAESAYLKSLELRRLEGDPQTIARALCNLGCLRDVQARSAEALFLYEEGLALIPRHTSLAADLIGNIAVALSSLGRPRDATVYHWEAVAIDEKVFGAEHPSVATDLLNLSCHLVEMGRPLEAVEPRIRALRIKERIFGAEDVETLHCELGYGVLLRILGRYRESEAVLGSCLVRLESRVGIGHSLTARCLAGLATTYHELGKYGKARDYAERARSLFEALWPNNHPDVVRVRHLNVFCLCSLGLTDLALALAESTLAEVGEVQVALDALAHVYRETSRTNEALALEVRSRALYRAEVGDDHPDVRLDSSGQSEADLREALQIREAAYGLHDPQLAPILDQLSSKLRSQGKLEESETFVERSLDLVEAARGSAHPFLATTLRVRGRLRQAQGHCLGAEADFLRALAIIEASEAPDPRQMKACLKCLAEHRQQRGEASMT